jgi:methionine synthase II (cobalamin-independent)
VWLTTDCGLRALPRLVAREKLRSLVGGAEIVRQEIGDRSAATAT